MTTAIGMNGSLYSQNFDTLVPSGTESESQLPLGWYFDEVGTGANSTLTADNGSSTAADTYSYGANGSTDRALGELAVGSSHSIMGAVFTNDTDRYIDTITISYTGEQWHGNGVLDRLDFQYALYDSYQTAPPTTFSNVDALDFTVPNWPGPHGALNGNDPSNQAHIQATFYADVAPGQSIYVQWVPNDTVGTGNGLAIDNFSLQPNFYPTKVKDDFNGDGKSDILWHNDNGAVSVWDSGQLSGAHIVETAGAVGSDWHIADTGSFYYTTPNELLWRNDDGSVTIGNNPVKDGSAPIGGDNIPAEWHVAGTGDFNGDSQADIVWRDDNGAVSIWNDGRSYLAQIVAPAGAVPTSWKIIGTGDFDGNGTSDILWRNDNGAVSIWDSGQIDHAHLVANAGTVTADWHFAGTGDFNKDGHDDILWRNDNGALSIWDSGQLSGAHIIVGAGVVGNDWHIAATGDYDGNGFADIVWRNDNGAVSIWDNAQISHAHIVAAAGVVGSDWHIT